MKIHKTHDISRKYTLVVRRVEDHNNCCSTPIFDKLKSAELKSFCSISLSALISTQNRCCSNFAARRPSHMKRSKFMVRAKQSLLQILESSQPHLANPEMEHSSVKNQLGMARSAIFLLPFKTWRLSFDPDITPLQIWVTKIVGTRSKSSHVTCSRANCPSVGKSVVLGLGERQRFMAMQPVSIGDVWLIWLDISWYIYGIFGIYCILWIYLWHLWHLLHLWHLRMFVHVSCFLSIWRWFMIPMIVLVQSHCEVMIMCSDAYWHVMW